MARLLDLSKNSLQYGNSMCPSMNRKLKVIVYFRKIICQIIAYSTENQCVRQRFEN
jgi:hypothetical protein